MSNLIGKEIAEIRKSQGLTQEELANRANVIRCSSRYTTSNMRTSRVRDRKDKKSQEKMRTRRLFSEFTEIAIGTTI